MRPAGQEAGSRTVLYLVGSGRSATTLMGNILNEIPGWIHLGELRALWQMLLTSDQAVCGCGRLIVDCPFWSRVLPWPLAGGGTVGSPLESVVDLQRRVRVWHSFTAGSASGPRGQYLRLLEAVYDAIFQVSGARVIVDSSKAAGDARLIRGLAGARTCFVHLVRDPRGVAHSWGRRHEHLLPQPPWRAALRWDLDNLAAEAATRGTRGSYLRLRYEDFARDPEPHLREIAGLAGEDAPPAVREGTVVLGENHTVIGNPDRFQRGEIPVSPDDGWREEMPLATRRLVEALTFPLMGRYGYR